MSQRHSEFNFPAQDVTLVEPSRFVQAGVQKLPGRRIVSLDSGRTKPSSQTIRVGYAGPGGFATRAHSAESAIDNAGLIHASLMVPLNFDKVQDDIAHPLSSLRSCSEFGVHGVGAAQEDKKSAPKKKSIWKRTVGWFKKEKKTKNIDTDGVLSLAERSRLAHMGEEFRQQRLVSTQTRNRLWSTQPAPRYSDESTHSGYNFSIDNRRDSTNHNFSGSSKKKTNKSHSPSFSTEVKTTFWGTLGFDTPQIDCPKDIEMKTFRIAGAWVLPIENGFSPITRSSSARSLSSRDSLTSRPSFFAGGTYVGRPAPTTVVDISVFDIVFSDLWHLLYVSESSKAFAEYSLLCIDYLRDLSMRFGEEGFMDAMRIQPVSTGNYFRCMLITGIVSTLFNGYTLVGMYYGYDDAHSHLEFSTLMGTFFFCWLFVMTLLNLVQLPLRIIIHMRLLQISQATVHEAGDILRDLVGSDVWICNRLLNWLLDLISIIGLFLTEVYFFTYVMPLCTDHDDVTSCSSANTLGSVVVNSASTVILTLMIRMLVVLMFCISAIDPQTLSEARKRGLSRYDVDKLPAFLYTDRDEVNNSTCAICLCSFDMGEMLISLPCDNRHSFHASCIRDWLVRQNACPLCQKLV